MFGVSHPKTGQTVKLFRSKFAASGRAPSGQHPLLGLLEGTTSGAVASGRTVREPRGNRETWVMVFSLEEIPTVLAESFTLTIFRVNGHQLHQLGNPVTGIKFANYVQIAKGKGAQRNIEIIFPEPNTSHCRFGFASYGLLTNPDTRISDATLEDEVLTAGPAGNDYVDCDNEGFWVAAFDEVADSSATTPNTTYKLKIQGNVTTENSIHLTFRQNLC